MTEGKRVERPEWVYPESERKMLLEEIAYKHVVELLHLRYFLPKDLVEIIHHYAREFQGRVVRTIGNGRLSCPTGVAVDDRFIFVTDEEYHAVFVFERKTGHFVHMFGGEDTDDHPALYTPRDVACDDQHVYIIEYKPHRLQKFTKDGAYVMQWGNSGSNCGSQGYGKFWYCAGVEVDKLYVYVAEAVGNRVQIFTKEGLFIHCIKDMPNPRGLTLDDRTLYVTGTGDNTIRPLKITVNNAASARRIGARGEKKMPEFDIRSYYDAKEVALNKDDAEIYIHCEDIWKLDNISSPCSIAHTREHLLVRAKDEIVLIEKTKEKTLLRMKIDQPYKVVDEISGRETKITDCWCPAGITVFEHTESGSSGLTLAYVANRTHGNIIVFA